MNRIEEKKKKRRVPYTFYAILLAAALVTAVSTLSQAANFVNTDGYINLSSTCTNLTNGTCVVNYNTTRYANSTTTGLLTSTDWARFNSSTSSNSSDGNNYTTSQAFERSSNNIILQTSRNGMDNVSAFFTLQSTTGILLSNGVYYANATNCTSGQYSRYEQNGWNCYNDASGGGISGVTTTNTDGYLNLTTNGTNIDGRINLTAFDERYLTETLRLYLWNTTSSINSSYDTMNSTISPYYMTNVFSNIPTGTNALTKYLYNNTLRQINSGAYTLHLDINVTGGSPNKVMLFNSELIVVNTTSGARTVIGTGVADSYLTTTIQGTPIGIEFGGGIITQYNFSADERLSLEINITISGGGGNQPSIVLLTGDGSGASLSFGVNPEDILEALTSVGVSVQSDNNSVLVSGSPLTSSGTINFTFYNATVSQTGLLRAVDFTTFNNKAGVGNCVGYNSTHVNVTMNSTTAGVQCVAVSLNPGSSIPFDPSGLYVNITDLQTSNSSTNTRVNSVNSSLLNFVLVLGQNDTNLNNSINAVNTRVTTTNDTLQLALTNITTLQTTKFDSAGTGLEATATTVGIEIAYQLPQGCGDGDVPTWNLSFGWWNCSPDINQYANVTALQAFRNAIYINTTDLQNSNASINVRIDTLNTTIQNLLSSNGSIYTRIDTLNITIQNLLTSNTTLFGLILQLGQNDTNLNASINAVNTRATTINGSVDSLATNLTTLSNTAITTLGFTAGGSNSTVTNSTTIYLYAGSGITLNQSGTGTTIVSTATGGSGGDNTSVLHPVSAFALLEQEFTHITSTSAYSFLGAGVIGTGAIGFLDGEINHPGIITMSDSATANNGYFVRTAVNAFLLNETEQFTAVIRAPGGKSGTTAIISGFFDTGTTDNTIVDGCYMMYNLSQTNVRSIGGRCKTNSVITYTTTNYTATNNTWYTLKGYLGNNGKAFNFSVYNGTGTLLWSENVTTNIPTNSVNLFRQTGAGILAYENTTNAVSVIAHVDYFSIGMNRTLNRY